MEIHTLKVSISEEDIHSLIAASPPGKSPVENLRVRLTPDGILVLGDYPALFMKMAFETLWEVQGAGSVVVARLASIKVSGLPAAMLRGVLMKTIRDMTAHEPGVSVEEESIRIDLSKHSEAQKLRLRVNLIGVRCDTGQLVIEAGPMIA